ncbi:peroxide stress protein YaaA [Corynebacterium sp. A21]|uniref:peroxide stress protein YaaA n=1 Tax=Corynebacterium sp. A21 TaxID=3457318 RepID=UPI003FD69E69
MLILLPPSETKAFGGDGPALDWEALSFPELNPVRSAIAADLIAMPPAEMQAALGLSAKLFNEVAANLEFFGSPTMPAIHRYTGVLYDALDPGSLDDAAVGRLAIGSALFGVVGAGDPIPHYRLSGGSKIPEAAGTGAKVPTMKARWGKMITTALTEVPGLVVDLRSGTYQQLGKLPGAVTVRVEAIQDDGSRKVVSHFNKFYKGQLARVLVQSSTDPAEIAEVAEVAQQAGMTVELGPTSELTMVVSNASTVGMSKVGAKS